MSEKSRAVLVLALATLLCYSNGLNGTFHYDDHHSIKDNSALHSLGNTWRFFADPQLFSADPDKGMYRPLLLLSYALNYEVFGDRAWGYLVVNWLIHLGCSYWVWALARILVGRGRVALFCGLLFALHPLAGEPVNYISSRSESLMACFYLSALWTYLQQGQKRWGRRLSLVLFGAALLVKSVAITLPLALVLLDLYQRGRLQSWRVYASYGLVGIAYLGLIGANGFLGKSLSAPVRGSAQQLWTQAKAGPYYAKLLLMPWGLSAEHQFFVATHWGQAAVLAGLGLIGSLAWLGWKNRGVLWGFCLLWSGLVLLPASAMPLNVLVNERRLYLSLAGLAWLLGFLLERANPRLLWLAIPCLALLSFQRNLVWKDELSLWADAVSKAPKMYRVQTNLGKALQLAGRDQEAWTAYTQAIAIDSSHGDAYNNMATLLHLNNQIEAAIIYYEKALARYPNRAEIEQNLADALGQIGQVDRALPHYRRALKLAPDSGSIWNNMGQMLYGADRLGEAENAFQQALRLMPNRPEPHNNLGNIYSRQKQYDLALAHYGHALGLADENQTEILLNLSDTYRQLGEFEQGRRLLDRALLLERDNPSIHHALGRLERGAGRKQIALAAFERATGLDAKHSKALVETAELRCEAGNWAAAAQTYRRALEVDSDSPRAWYGLGRSLERSGQPGAADAYRRFLGLWAVKDQRRAWVEERLEHLEATP